VAQNQVIKSHTETSRPDHGWRILAMLSIRMKEMVGTWGLKPQTSTMSILRSTTQNPV